MLGICGKFGRCLLFVWPDFVGKSQYRDQKRHGILWKIERKMCIITINWDEVSGIKGDILPYLLCTAIAGTHITKGGTSP